MPVKSQHLERLESALSRLTRTLAARAGGETGLSPSQRIILRALSSDELQISDVAATLGVTLSAATGLIDRMARAGLVTRVRDQADRRVVWVRITEAGRAAFAEAERVRRQVLEEAVQPLGEAELERLVDLLEKLKM